MLTGQAERPPLQAHSMAGETVLVTMPLFWSKGFGAIMIGQRWAWGFTKIMPSYGLAIRLILKGQSRIVSDLSE
jgi:hypothetical protein